MHRDILKTNLDVDHKNRDGLDNRRSNLRKATRQQNSANSIKKHFGKDSKFKGVCRSRDHWRAQIVVNYKAIFIGCFATEIKAAEAYDREAKKHFGKFARLNHA